MSVKLTHKAAFEEVLATYEPSAEAKNVLASIQLGILLGLAGSGRNTIINELVKSGGYHFIVSDTTRPPKVRDGKLEQNGINYYFIDEKDMLADLRNGQFLEAELIHQQQVSGISIRELERAYASGKIPVNEVDIAGTVNIRKYKPDTNFIFVLPPSYEAWVTRLKKRENMDEAELANRMRTALRVIDEAFKHDDWNFVINDKLEDAVDRVKSVLSGSDVTSQDDEARRLATEIRNKISTRIE